MVVCFMRNNGTQQSDKILSSNYKKVIKFPKKIETIADEIDGKIMQNAYKKI